mgnify:CR=1 FL=1
MLNSTSATRLNTNQMPTGIATIHPFQKGYTFPLGFKPINESILKQKRNIARIVVQSKSFVRSVLYKSFGGKDKMCKGKRKNNKISSLFH